MPRFAIVIPSLGQADRLEETLVSVLEHRPPQCEIVVVHRGEYADPYSLAGEVRFIVAPPGAGLAECANRGVQSARSPFIHLLQAGVTVTHDWTAPCLGRFRDVQIAAVAPLVVCAAEGRIVSTGLDYHCGGLVEDRGRGSAWTADDLLTHGRVLGPAAWAGFYRKSVLEELGGCDGALGDELTFADLALRLYAAGHACWSEPESRMGWERAIRPVRPSLHGGRRLERLFWRHRRAAGAKRSIAAHLLVAAGELGCVLFKPRMALGLLGRCMGLADCARGRHLPPSAAPPTHVAQPQAPATGIQRRVDQASAFGRPARQDSAEPKRPPEQSIRGR